MLMIFVHDANEATGESGEPLGMVTVDANDEYYYENWLSQTGDCGYPTVEEALSDLLAELGL